MKALLLENLHPLATSILARGRRRGRRPAGCARRGRADRRPRGRRPARHPVQDRGDREGARRRGPDLVAHRRLLHRHQPDRPRRRGGAGHRGVQRAVLQHPLGRRARDRRDHRAGPPAHRAGHGAARRGVGQVAPPAATRSAAARSASSATATSARSCRWWPRSLGMQVYFYDTDDKLALGNAPPLLVARRAARQRRDRHAARRRPGRATPASSAPSSSPGCGRGSLFLNLSRGFVVDYEALRDAPRLRSRRGCRGRRVPDGAEEPRATRSSRRCAGCPT